MSRPDEITYLFEKALRNEITPHERVKLFQLLGDEAHSEEVEALFNKARLDFDHQGVFFTEKESSQALDTLVAKVGKRTYRPNNTGIASWIAAASVVIVMSIAVYFYLGWKSPAPSFSKRANKYSIHPARKRATLALGNGKLIDIDALGNGTLQEGNIRIHKTNDGQLVYQIEKTNREDEVKQHVLSTPRGGHFQILLPDSSKVWLGPESSLHYPTRFEGDKRSVFLIGEAYLEVAKNTKMAFEVNTPVSTVQVLGTNFLISAYEDMDETTTTLIEGRVQVSAQRGSGTSSRPCLLQPGQRASINKYTNAITLQSVDLEDALAWKNGYFAFHGDGIQDVMRTIAKWYDVDVIFKGDLSRETFMGTVSRFDDIHTLLQTIALTGGVHFTIEGRKIMVMK